VGTDIFSKFEMVCTLLWLTAAISCSLGLSATSQQYFSLRTNQPPATSQQYFSLRTNQHQPSATSQTNRQAAFTEKVLCLMVWHALHCPLQEWSRMA
jgi:hypothetical protein